MKIRHNFVSNSSSSSFILQFPERIETKEQLKKYLCFDCITTDSIEHRKILDILFRDIQHSYNIVDLDDLDHWDMIQFLEDNDLNVEALKYKSFSDIYNEITKGNRVKLIYGDDYPEDSLFEHCIAPFIFGEYLIDINSNR